MVRTLWSVGILALLAGTSPAFGQYGAYGGYGGTGLQYALAHCDAKGKVHVRQIFVIAIPESQTRKRTNPDGKVVEYTVTVYKNVLKENVREVDAKEIQVLGGTGKKINSKGLPDLLEKETPVLVAQPNQKVDPVYFKILKKDALILVLPRLIAAPRPAPKGPVKEEEPSERPKEPVQKADLPKGPQPHLGRATIDDNTFRLRQRHEYSYLEKRVGKVEKDGKEVPEEFIIKNSTLTIMTKELEAKYVQVFGTDGKQVPRKTYRQRLEKEPPVLVSADGQKVDPFYLRLFKKGTLVVVVPQTTTYA